MEVQQLILKSNSKTQIKTFVHSDITKYLKTHQIDGIQFLFENCYEQSSGCILAHCMGLGKTLQVISLLHSVINSKDYPTNKILVLCPISTIINWKEEIVRWLDPINGHRKLRIFELDQKDDIHRKISSLQKWSQCDSESPAACLIMGYEAFRNLVNFHLSKANSRKYTESNLRQISERIKDYLLKPADIVICDEGHIIKNISAAITLAVNQIQTKRRIILTGTPMQNHLMEYYSMVNFVKPNFLGTKQHFNEYFAEPIKNGQHADSCEADIKYMKQRSYALNKKLSKIVQRREISLLKDFLPEKFEFVLFVPLTEIQYTLYKYFLENRGGSIEYKRLFGDYTCLRKIWTHFKVLDNAHQKSVAKKKRATKSNDDDNTSNDDDDEEELASSGGLQMVDNDWWRRVIDKNQLESALSSNKMIILFEILKECQRVGDKCVIFSSFVEVLNVVEFFMQQIDQQQKNGNAKSGLENFAGPWKKNEDYYRLDGSTPKDRRHSMITKFNDVNNKRTKVFLISAQAGGQGINLFGANRLILLDTSWNPSKDQQSIFRIYRMGQVKNCYIYRLLSMGTMEEKIYSRSVTKQAMSCRVVDKQQIDRHYSMNELYELYSLTKTNMKQRPVPISPKDNLLAHLLQKYPDMVYKYLEHDTLLANKAEEELNDVEKNEAWQRCQEQNSNMLAPNVTFMETQTVASSSQTPSIRAPVKLQNRMTEVTTLEVKEPFVVRMDDTTSAFTEQLVDSSAEDASDEWNGPFSSNEVNQECSEVEENLDALPSFVRFKSSQSFVSESSSNEIESSKDDAVEGEVNNAEKNEASQQCQGQTATIRTPVRSQTQMTTLDVKEPMDEKTDNSLDNKKILSFGKQLSSSQCTTDFLNRPSGSSEVNQENSDDKENSLLFSQNPAIPTPVKSQNQMLEVAALQVKEPMGEKTDVSSENDKILSSSENTSDFLNGPFRSNEVNQQRSNTLLNHQKLIRFKSCPVLALGSSSNAIESSKDGNQRPLLSLGNVDTEHMDSTEKRAANSLSAFARGLLHTLNVQYTMPSQQRNAPNTVDDYTREEKIISSNQLNNFEYRVAFKRPSDSSTNQRAIKRLKLSLEIDPRASIGVDRILSTLSTFMLSDTSVRQDFIFMEHPQSLNTNNVNLHSNDVESNVANVNGTEHFDHSSTNSSEDEIDSEQVVELPSTVKTETEFEQTTLSNSAPFNGVSTENSTEEEEEEEEEMCPKNVSSELVTVHPPNDERHEIMDLQTDDDSAAEDEQMSPNNVSQSKECITVKNGILHYDEQPGSKNESMADSSAEDEEMSSNILQHSHEVEEMAFSSDEDEEISNILQHSNEAVDNKTNASTYSDDQYESEQDSLADVLELETAGEQDLHHHETTFVREDVSIEEFNSFKEQPSIASKIKDACVLM